MVKLSTGEKRGLISLVAKARCVSGLTWRIRYLIVWGQVEEADRTYGAERTFRSYRTYRTDAFDSVDLIDRTNLSDRTDG